MKGVRIMRKYNLSEITEKIEGYNVAAIRHCCKDENYEVGDFCRNSYEWDEENEISSYYTSKEEMDGTCGYDVSALVDCDDVETAKKILDDAIEASSIYEGNDIVLIGGYSYEYGNDDNEIIIEDAEVIAKL